MSYQKAYQHLFNRMSEVIERIEASKSGEEINIPLILRQIQREGEEVVICNRPAKAPRSGSSTK